MSFDILAIRTATDDLDDQLYPVPAPASCEPLLLMRPGKVLVGQVRYCWLRSVGASSKQGWLDTEQIRLELVDGTAGTARRLLLDLSLPKPIEAVPLAREITHRAALHWLAPGRATTPEDRCAFERLVSPPPLRPEPKKFAFYTLPVYDGVTGSVAG